MSVLHFLIFSQIAALSAEPITQPVDPAELVVPKSSPEFRQVVHPDAWQRRFDAALAELGGIKGLEESKAPDFGDEILRVRPGQPADALGIVIGDILTQVDDVVLRGIDLNTARRNRPQKITVVGKNAQPRILDINPGLIGIDMETLFRPELVYIRRGTRGPAWDAFAAVGAAYSQRDPALAETAWRAAIAAGYKPDFISDLCGALIAWRQGRNDEAVAFLACMETRQKRHPELSAERWVRRIALANFKVKQALAGRMIPDAQPTAPKDSADTLLNAELLAHRALPAIARTRPSPFELTALKKDDLLTELAPLMGEPRELTAGENFVQDALRNRRTLPFREQTDHYNTFLLKPKAQTSDMEVEARLKFWPTDNGPSQHFKAVYVGIIDCDKVAPMGNVYPESGATLAVGIRDIGTITVFQGAGNPIRVQAFDGRMSAAHRQSITLRLIHAGGRDEVWLNQQRILHLPSLDRPRNLGIHLGVSGMSIDLDTRVWKLNLPQ